ncbi:MAG TPA: tripartite tricarboxylate transporter substrate-binding protein, partial [Thermodesulfobacteriota bacterium]|nr:tripartite tricarboxylate transporter substrate-binding protein [Thermodesulfobacteriota bacterium]
HICMEALSKAAGFQATHIPFSGANAAMAAALGGHVDVGIASGSTGMAGPGKLRILAIAHKERLALFPNVPTLKEIGYPIYGITYHGLWAPKGTPKEIMQKIFTAHKKTVEEKGKEIEKTYRELEHELLLLDPEELWAAYQADYDFQKKMLGEMGALIK